MKTLFSLVAASLSAALLFACSGLRTLTGRSDTLPSSAGAKVVGNSFHTVSASNDHYRILHDFGSGSDGLDPEGSLAYENRVVYGTTVEGGTNEVGTVFAATVAGSEMVLHSFSNTGADGFNPYSRVIFANNDLYGTTQSGGEFGSGSSGYNGGVVFRISRKGVERVLHSFGKDYDGDEPAAGLLNVNGTFYGTTYDGGERNKGAVYSISPKGTERVLYSFGGMGDGKFPVADLANLNNTLYGTTETGGKDGRSGTVFSITIGGKERVLHSFDGVDGANPVAGLTRVKGVLYGTAYSGGKYSHGVAFRISPTGDFTVVHNFGPSPDGSDPNGRLVNANGVLYGVTFAGGTNPGPSQVGAGTAFSMSYSGNERVLHNFGANADGVRPQAGLINVDGTLYGTAREGGQYGGGILFSMVP